jgi:hypothetical protein
VDGLTAMMRWVTFMLMVPGLHHWLLEEEDGYNRFFG